MWIQVSMSMLELDAPALGDDIRPIPRNIRDPKVSNHHSHPKSSKSSNFSGISLASTKWPGFVWRYGVHGTQIAQASSRSTIYANGLSTTPSVAMMTEKFVTRSWVQIFKSRSNHSHCLLNCLLPIFWCLDPKYSKMVVGATESKSKIAWAPTWCIVGWIEWSPRCCCFNMFEC